MESKIGTIVTVITLSIITILVMIDVVSKKKESTPLLFPKDATLKQKIAIILCMLICVLTSFGIFAYLYFHILINDYVISALIIPTVVASLLIIICLYRALSNETSIVSKVANKLKQGPIKFILSMCGLVPIVLAAVIIIALPSTLHMFTSESGELVVTVKQKNLWYQSRSCNNGGISIKENTYYIINNKVCGISENDWNSLVPGDKMQLSGKISYFGFSYDLARKIR